MRRIFFMHLAFMFLLILCVIARLCHLYATHIFLNISLRGRSTLLHDQELKNNFKWFKGYTILTNNYFKWHK